MDNAPVPTFPIPQQEADFNQLADHLEAVNQGIASISSAIQGGLTNQLTPIQQGYDAINRKIMTGMNGMMRPINAGVTAIDNAIYQQTASQVSEIGVQATIAEQMLGGQRPQPTGTMPETLTYTWVIMADCERGIAMGIPTEEFELINLAIESGWQEVGIVPPKQMSVLQFRHYLQSIIGEVQAKCN